MVKRAEQSKWCLLIDDKLYVEPGDEFSHQQRQGRPEESYVLVFQARVDPDAFPGREGATPRSARSGSTVAFSENRDLTAEHVLIRQASMESSMNLRFHWMLPKGGEVAVETAKATAGYRTRCYERTSPARQPDMEGWGRFARSAEEAGIESVLISCGPYEPDSLLTACALGRETKKLKFIAAFRSGWMQPTTFVQQFNTLSQLVKGRVALNMVAGSSTDEQHTYGDFLEHDERYARAEEFSDRVQCFLAKPR